MDHIAQRVSRINISQSVAIAELARRLKAEGRDIINLSIGEPDFDTPEPARLAAIQAIESGQTRYTNVAGTPALRQAIIERFQKDYGITYRQDEIIACAGGKQAIFNAMFASLDPGDEVIIPTPCWVSYPDIVTLAEGRPVFVPCSPAHDFLLQAEELERSITPATRWLILNNPCNPTGAAYSAQDLKPLCEVLLRHPQVWVLTDDIYDKLVFDGFEFSTIAQVEPRLKERTLTVNGCSKTYAMTGWRLGYAAGPRALIQAMDKLQGQSTSNPSSISQAAAVAALRSDDAALQPLIQTYQHRRDLVIEGLSRIPGISCTAPRGAFYVFPNIRGLLGKSSRGGARLQSDLDFVNALLQEQGVATVHGDAYMCPDYFRISYALDDSSLNKALERIRDFCAGLS